MGLDSEEVDEALRRHELSSDADSVEDCRAAIREEHPKRYENGRKSHWRQMLFGNPDLQ